MITSKHNPRIQRVRDLLTHPKARREEGAFVVEGVRLVEEALASSWPVELVLFSSELSARGQQVVKRYQENGSPVEEVSGQILKSLADTESPQGILAVLPARSLPLPQQPDFVLIADGLRDPGNLGTLLRTALAAGVQAVLLTPGSTDPYAPKVVRSGMGAHFHLPLASLTWPEIQGYLSLKNDPGMHIYLADSGGGQAYTQADLRSPLALIVGGEAEGAGREAQQILTGRVHIPMPGRAESLNAAVAAAILMFEVVRQRNL